MFLAWEIERSKQTKMKKVKFYDLKHKKSVMVPANKVYMRPVKGSQLNLAVGRVHGHNVYRFVKGGLK